MKLLELSEVHIRFARFGLNMAENPYMNDLVVFHCGQGLELLLKFILQRFACLAEDSELFRTHDITLLVRCVETNTRFSVPQRVKDLSADLTDWYVTARYGSGHVGSIATANDLVRAYEELRNGVEQDMLH